MGSIFSLLGMFATGNFRKLFTVLLGLALVFGLWETSLVNLSSRSTATAIMTEVGVDLINPVLVDHSFGVSQTAWAALQQTAKAHPTQALSLPGIKVKVLGSEILGKSFADGSRVIYTKVADAYYDGGGLNGVLDVPAPITQTIGALSLLPQAAANQGSQALGVPQLPQVVSQVAQLLAAIGLSPALFTRNGHDAAVTLDRWLLGAALLLAALLAVASRRWQRLTSVCWSLISSAVPGVLVIGVIGFFWWRNPAPFAPFKGLLDLIRGAVVPVYGGALGVGVAGLIVAFVGDLILKWMGHERAAPARAPMPARAPVAAGPRGGWGQAEPSYGQPEFRRPPLPGAAYGDQQSFGQQSFGQQSFGQRGYPAAPQPARPNPPNVDTFPWQPSPSGDRWPAAPASDDQWPPAPDRNAPGAGPRRSPQPGYGQGGYGQGGYGQGGYGQGGYGDQGWPDSGPAQPRSRGSGPASWPGGPQGADDDADAWPPPPPRRGGY